MSVFNKRALSRQLSSRTVKGFTLLELIVASGVSLTILGIALGMLSEQRRWMLSDRTRAVANDNLRLVSDLIGQDIRQAGERLESDGLLPSISIIPGANTTDPSTLVLQRKLLSETLPVCQNIVAGATGTTTIDVSVITGSPITNCNYSYSMPSGGEPSTALNTLRPTDNLRSWRTFRCTQDSSSANAGTDPCTTTTSGATSWAYIHDPVNNRGEFFQYSAEEQGSCSSSTLTSRTCQKIRRVGSSWTYSYTYDPLGTASAQPRLYLLEERRYSLAADTSTSRTDDYVLQLSINRQTPRRIANQVRNFKAWAKVPPSYTSAPFNAPNNWGCAVSGSSSNSPNPASPNQWYCDTFNVNVNNSDPVQRLQSLKDWQELQGIRITLTGINPNEQALKVDETSSNNLLKLSSEFLPRNVISK
ncbi:MAG: hypothetical protein MH252_22175 [Thermosynechococcaceae cyanobacterium MS004]|nr:hypothetical protein [Thermosynechococcaceae cyanobacterium MS004]